MATSRREHQLNARANRGVRNMSLGLKPSESEQGLRRARSVPTSPDRRLSPSPASSSSNASRPSSSFNTRTASSRSTSGSATSSTLGKTLHSTSYMAGAKQINTMRRKAEKPGATSVWPPALASANASCKDMTRAAKSTSTVQKSNPSTRPGIEKMTTSSVKLKTQKTMSGPLGAGKIQAMSSARSPGAITKKRTGAENYVSIQRTRSVPARQIETPKIEEQDVELLMEFDETESISTSSIEEHLQERLPDPVDLQSADGNSKPSSSQEEYKNEENVQCLLEDKQDGKGNELNACDNVLKGITSDTELKEDVDETELKEDVSAAELKKFVDETKLNEAAFETESTEAIEKTKLKEANCETALKEAAGETESRDAVAEFELIVEEQVKTKEEKIVPPAKPVELAQSWRKDDGRNNEATEEGRSRHIQERKNKVMALVGRFETAMSGRD